MTFPIPTLVREVVDSNLSATDSVDRDPYGNVIASVGSNPTPFGYTGEMLDSNGLAYHRARYYDAGLGSVREVVDSTLRFTCRIEW